MARSLPAAPKVLTAKMKVDDDYARIGCCSPPSSLAFALTHFRSDSVQHTIVTSYTRRKYGPVSHEPPRNIWVRTKELATLRVAI